jgi:hypothetical protein
MPPPPAGFLEYLALFSSQNGSLPPPPVPQPVSQRANVVPALPETPTPAPTAGREFNRPGRGTGGALTQKVKVSKQITASATKRKLFLDADVVGQLPASPEIVEAPNPKKVKRPKTAAAKVSVISICLDCR